ncbi:hypothetical protein FOZ63_013226, partial [Perkinsus olseni]
MSAFEADASVQLPRMVPFDNTWSAYNVKASPSVDRKDIIDIADDSYVTMRKKHSSSTDDGDGSLIINKGLEGYRHDVGMSGNAFTPDDGDVKPNSFVPVPEKNDDYDKLVSLYEEQRRSLLRLQDKLGLKGDKSVPADNFGRFVDDFGQQVNGPSKMKSQIPVDKVPSSPQGRSDPFFPQGMKDLSDRQPEVISTPLRGYDPSSPKVIEDMSGRLPEVGSSPSLKDVVRINPKKASVRSHMGYAMPAYGYLESFWLLPPQWQKGVPKDLPSWGEDSSLSSSQLNFVKRRVDQAADDLVKQVKKLKDGPYKGSADKRTWYSI